MALSVAGCDPRFRGGRLCLKVRQGGRIVPVAAIIAVAANTEGRREIIGPGIGPSEGLCCTNRVMAGPPLSPDRPVLRPL